MMEPESQCTFVNLVEKQFDRSFARGYSYQRSGDFVVQKLNGHNQPEAAKKASEPSWLRSFFMCVVRPGYGLDTGTCGGPTRQ